MSVYSEGCDSQTDPMDAEEEEGVSEEQYEQAFCAIVNEVFSKEDGEKYLDYENFNVQVEKLTPQSSVRSQVSTLGFRLWNFREQTYWATCIPYPN